MTDERLLRFYRWLAMSYRFPGRERFLRAVYNPMRRADDYYEGIIEFDRGLIHMNTASYIEWSIFFNRYYNEGMVDLIHTLVKPGFVCIDVGANVGSLTLVMAWATGPSGKVFAFEPHPVIYRRLAANVALNRLWHVALYDQAISNQEGPVPFYTASPDDANQAKSSIRRREYAGVTREITVQAVRGTSIREFEALAACDFIKVDTEGHDFVVIQEIAPLIDRLRPHVVFEYSRRAWLANDIPLAPAIDFFKSRGYSLYNLKSRKPIHSAEQAPGLCDILCVPNALKR
ncbi:MAG: FkbM family methyltransferase [Chloroflexi bacterium]|nr:FkbM family methyltransferase [Chloroflexota bacterium]MBI3732690.1 FkbM family methyltransferase [Chloroflexota bacterium]